MFVKLITTVYGKYSINASPIINSNSDINEEPGAEIR